MDTIGVALIGSGYIAHYHARGLAELANVEVSVLCSLDGKAAEEFADKYGIGKVTDQIKNLLGEGYPFFIDPASPEDIAKKLENVLSSNTKKRVERNYSKIRSLTWENICHTVRSVYEIS